LGCSCGPTPNVLEAFDASGNVAILKAISVEKMEVGSGESAPYSPVDGVSSTRMVVEKVYKGKLKVGDEITFVQGGGADCIWTFSEESVGRTFLFYLQPGDKATSYWMAGVCGRSTSLERAGEDLLYLDNLDKVRGKTRISGTLEFEEYDDVQGSPSVEGIKIRIVGAARQVTVKTDRNGVYEFYGLPAGKYRIIPVTPKGWKVNNFYLTYTDVIMSRDEDDEDQGPLKEYWVKLNSKKHASVDFRMEIDNSLGGKVHGPNGELMNGVCVRLYSPSGIDSKFKYHADCTKVGGAFSIRKVPPGAYVLVANDDNKITSDEPFPTIYFPGVTDLEKATVINVGFGESRADLNIFVPQVQELVTVKGRLLYSDKRPVVGESVYFYSGTKLSRYPADSTAETDDQGRFELKILRGMKGRIVGSMYTYLGEFEQCPRLDALIKETGKSNIDATSDEVIFDTEGNLFDVELKFPFPSCKKSKD